MPNQETTFVPTAKPTTERDLASWLERLLATSLPPNWSIRLEEELILAERVGPDSVATVEAPDGTRTLLLAEVRLASDSATIKKASTQLTGYIDALADKGEGACGVVVAPYIPTPTQKWLRDRNLNFVDATGNAWITCGKPVLFIRSTGARKNPWPDSRSLQSLKGRATGAAVRALLDFRPPYGIRELAGRAEVSAATLSRVVDLLEQEGAVEREKRGSVRSVDWEAVLRRWSFDYDVLESNSPRSFLAPRGADSALAALGQSDREYAVTGSRALPSPVRIAPSRLLMAYVRDLSATADELNLRQVDSGANAILLEPYDDVVFRRTHADSEGVNVAIPQVAIDLLTGPGRSPSEGEELLEWMSAHEDEWRV